MLESNAVRRMGTSQQGIHRVAHSGRKACKVACKVARLHFGTGTEVPALLPEARTLPSESTHTGTYSSMPSPRRYTGPKHARGQSLVELALILPILLVMALAVFDFARAFATAITIESAAREAADFGGLYPWHWDSSDPAAIPATEQEMETRACTSASTLPDYEGDDPASPPTPGVVGCTNPTVTYTLVPDPANTPNCYEVPRDQVPCRVEVTVTHEFEVIVPLRLQFGDTVLGFPDSVTIARTSTFAVSNFEIDPEPSP